MGKCTSDSSVNTALDNSFAQFVRFGARKIILGDVVEGLGFFPRASLFGHSCTPNVEWFNLKDVIVLLTNAGVENGEDLFISLIDQTQCVDGRTEELNRLFNIVCNCYTCAALKGMQEGRWIAIVVFAVSGSGGYLSDGCHTRSFLSAYRKGICKYNARMYVVLGKITVAPGGRALFQTSEVCMICKLTPFGLRMLLASIYSLTWINMSQRFETAFRI
jgi:hypothetical protein